MACAVIEGARSSRVGIREQQNQHQASAVTSQLAIIGSFVINIKKKQRSSFPGNRGPVVGDYF